MCCLLVLLTVRVLVSPEGQQVPAAATPPPAATLTTTTTTTHALLDASSATSTSSSPSRRAVRRRHAGLRRRLLLLHTTKQRLAIRGHTRTRTHTHPAPTNQQPTLPSRPQKRLHAHQIPRVRLHYSSDDVAHHRHELDEEVRDGPREQGQREQRGQAARAGAGGIADAVAVGGDAAGCADEA